MVIKSKPNQPSGSKYISDQFKLISFLYAAYMTKSVRVTTSYGMRVAVADLYACKEQTRLTRFCFDFYHDVSTINHICVAIFFLFCKTQKLNSNESNYYLRCYSPRYVIIRYTDIENCLTIGFILCGVHLIYRYLVRIHVKEFNIDMVSFVMAKEEVYQKYLNEIGESIKLDRDIQMNTKLHPMIDLMYYRCKNQITKKIELKLRPNRDEECRQKLFQFVDRIFEPLASIGMVVSIGYFVLSCYYLIIDQDELYHECPNEYWSFAYVLRNSLAFSILAVHSLDHLVFLFFSVLTTPVLVYDLDIYLAGLMRKIRKIQLQLTILTSTCSTNQTPAGFDDAKAGFSCGRSSRLAKYRIDRTQINEDIGDLQANLLDFFTLVGRTDEFISIIIPFSIAVWLIANGYLTLSGLQFQNSVNAMAAIRAFQLMYFIMSGLISCSVLEFKRQTEQAYESLCSIIALDPNINKNRWIPIMSFYTHRARYCFTFFGLKIYTRLAYFSYISYTFTFMLFIENIRFGRNRT